MELFIKNTPKVLVFVLLFFSLSAYSQQQEGDHFPFQQYTMPSNTEVPLIGDSPQELCEQYKNAVLIPHWNKSSVPYIIEKEYLEYEVAWYAPRCRWVRRVHYTEPYSYVINTAVFVYTHCQRLDKAPNPYPYQYAAPHQDYDVQSCEFRSPHTVFDQEIQWCTLPPDLPKDNCNTTNNPCQVSTGAKFRNEVDFADSSLGFNRRYHSQNLSDQGLGKGWHNAYLKNLLRSGDNHLSIVEGTGRGEPWRKVNGTWQGDADSDYVVTETPTGFTVTNKFKQVSDYDSEGRLLTETVEV